MRIVDYLWDRLFEVILFLFAVLLSTGFLWLIDLRGVFIVFFEMIFVIIFLIEFLWDYFRRQSYYNRLLQILENLDEKTLLMELAEESSFLDGRIMSDIIRQSNKYMNDQLSQESRLNKEYREYVEMWVHEIKTPITSAYLIIENDKNRTTLRIDEEIRKIDHFVEQALYYARSTTLEKDFKVEKVMLKDIVNDSIKSYSKSIIQAGGRMDFKNLEICVYADTKWCIFMICQVIANSVKYRKENLTLSFLGISEENGIWLIIKDNGIGIPASDISRVFDKGFTGENGRHFSKSTGIGLYLCKKLCYKMHMEISVESIENKYTAISFWFPKESMLFKSGT